MIPYERACRWRKILLHAATLSLAVAWGEGFRIIRVFVSSRHALALVLVILASFLAAVGIRLIAGHLFDTEDEPWYARFTAALYIAGMIATIMAVTAPLAETFSDSSLSQALPVKQMVPLGIAFTSRGQAQPQTWAEFAVIARASLRDFCAMERSRGGKAVVIRSEEGCAIVVRNGK